MKNISRVSLGLVTALSLLLLGLVPSAQAQTAAQRAKYLSQTVSLATFMKVYNAPKKGLDTQFNWKNYDGCSVPGIPGMTSGWNAYFKKSCLRHDFGYRNLGHGKAYYPTPASKNAIDAQFKDDMETQCRSYSNFAKCWSVAQAYYNGLHRTFSDKSWTAFTGSSCPSASSGSGAWFCLFDDHSYGDRRMVFKSVGENNMNDIDFGDKTSSAINNTSVAWVLYDDHDYKDTKFCLKAGQRVRDFDAYGFGDKTSSLKRMSSNTCPSGSRHL